MPALLFLSHDHRGMALLREAKAQGYRTILLTRDRFRDADWPWEAIDEFFVLPSLDEALPLVTRLMREQHIDRILAVHERDVQRAAALREIFCLPGMTREVALRFRDKLAMRQVTSEAGIPNPPFVHLLHHPTVHRFTLECEPPWMLKPRSEAGSLGIARIESAAALWNAVERLGDEASHYLLEQRIHGEVYHLDSLVHQSRVVFCQTHHYGTPPFEVWNHGGVFSSASLASDDPVAVQLSRLNQRVLLALGLNQGVAHVEFLGGAGGSFSFLEAACRVGGANIDALVEKASGVNLWREWLKIELQGEGYRPPERRYDSAVLLQCLARQVHPDLSDLVADEIVWKLELPQHAGVIVAAPNAARVRQSADRLKHRLEASHLAVLPPQKAPL
jgi:biotin carboxylase